jgi:hypothetical protein
MGYFVPPLRAANGGPSEAQLKFARDLAQKNSLVIPEDTLQSGKALSAWIQDLVGDKRSRAPVAAAAPAAKGAAKRSPQ